MVTRAYLVHVGSGGVIPAHNKEKTMIAGEISHLRQYIEQNKSEIKKFINENQHVSMTSVLEYLDLHKNAARMIVDEHNGGKLVSEQWMYTTSRDIVNFIHHYKKMDDGIKKRFTKKHIGRKSGTIMKPYNYKRKDMDKKTDIFASVLGARKTLIEYIEAAKDPAMQRIANDSKIDFRSLKAIIDGTSMPTKLHAERLMAFVLEILKMGPEKFAAKYKKISPMPYSVNPQEQKPIVETAKHLTEEQMRHILGLHFDRLEERFELLESRYGDAFRNINQNLDGLVGRRFDNILEKFRAVVAGEINRRFQDSFQNEKEAASKLRTIIQEEINQAFSPEAK
jgi:hypothetical protein